MIKRYDFAEIKSIYQNAEATFKAQNVNTKEPNKMAFTSKLYYKFLAANNESIDKGLNNPTNKQYYNEIMRTEGNYSRRVGNIGQNITQHVDYCKDLISKASMQDIKYSILGVFIDINKVINNESWKRAFKLSIDYEKKHKSSETICSAYKSLYVMSVIVMESLLMRVCDVEFEISHGMKPIEAIMHVQNKNAVFMQKVVEPMINLVVMMQKTPNPVNVVMQTINGESKSDRSTESASAYSVNERMSFESAWLDTLKNSAPYITGSTLALGATIAGGIMTHKGSSGGNNKLKYAGIAMMLLGALWFAFTIIPNIRIICYYYSISKVNMSKELELYAEMIKNNIADLKEKYENMPEGPEKEKLAQVIAKQEKMYSDAKTKLDREHAANEDAQDIDTAMAEDDENLDDAINDESVYGDDTSSNDDSSSDSDSSSSSSSSGGDSDGGFDIYI